MPQTDKEITDILGIPRLTLHSWKNSSSYTKLLYAILKNMSVAELKDKRDIAEKTFNLLIIGRDELYKKLYHHESLHRPNKYTSVELIANIDIASKDDKIIIRRSESDDSLEAHYILKGAHNKASAKKFIDKLLLALSERESIPKTMIDIHLYGVDLKHTVYASLALQGIVIKHHNLNETLGIKQELVIVSS